MRKFILRTLAVVTLLIVVIAVGGGLAIRHVLKGSLPQLDGELRVAKLTAPVTIERDGLGVPTIRAANRLDLAFATGFVHAQDRFFQMDLLRRNSAGELAELVGPAALPLDRKVRVHRFREVVKQVMANSGPESAALMTAYADGVNAGLESLAKKPFEYYFLRVDPQPWKAEDSALVICSMYLDLQGEDFADEATLGLLAERMPAAMFDFLAPRGTEWDAPVDGEAFAVATTPGPDVFDTRKYDKGTLALLAPVGSLAMREARHGGSNNWAVSAKRTADGRAIVADDMHLDIRVPHVWYRASFEWPAADGQGNERMTGVSLPGTPVIVVGSNGHVAWGFTNSEGDWVDAVVVEVDPLDKDFYLTPDGPRKFAHHTETIHAKGAADETLEVVSTIWGPIMGHDAKGRPLANHWVAYEDGGVNVGLLAVESAHTLEEALRLANQTGAPAQNFMVADDRGRIAWTIIGRIPRRVGFDGRLPTSWADGKCRWDGWLTPEEYPRIIDPENGRLWTANARVVSGEMLATVGDGGYDLGARAQQIRDDLAKIDVASEADMLAIQLDDRAVFLRPWRKLLLDVLSPEAVEADPRRGELRRAVEYWGDRAAPDSVGYRVVRTFRRNLIGQLSDVLVAPCKEVKESFSIAKLDRTEGPVWRLVSEKPENLIDPRYKNWDELLLAAADAVVTDATRGGKPISEYTWGNYNTTSIQHALSRAVPSLSPWLDMPARALAGDKENMPRIQGPSMGASQRMAVSPGHEGDGYLHMPCGQSGHPLSPHYRDAHAAWEEGRPTPFLPGATVHTLVLKPAA
ncbi:MAG: penicillin acylase family protein [Planctomycetia bacterium]|nr:penicillin acylase family protein [Planctomycetia bacterium]